MKKEKLKEDQLSFKTTNVSTKKQHKKSHELERGKGASEFVKIIP